jgi:hypothetical protein
VNGLVLINKDVGDERWAITRNGDGTITGNVFHAAGGPPAFLSCNPNGLPNGYTCWGVDACAEAPCGRGYALIGDVTLPAGFLERPSDCTDQYTPIAADIELPSDFFTPPATPSACGDHIAEGGEECDKRNLAGMTCASLGHPPGDLYCKGNCTFQKALCQSTEDFCEGFVERPSDASDCNGFLPGTICVRFEDNYYWILDEERLGPHVGVDNPSCDGRFVPVVIGITQWYFHILGTNLVRVD